MVDLIDQTCIIALAGRSKAISLLRELQFVSEAHFRSEEALLHQIEVGIEQRHLQTVVHAAIEEHVRSHRHGLEALHKLVERWRASSLDGDDAKLCDELKSWFIAHAIGQETQVKTILQSTRHLSDVD